MDMFIQYTLLIVSCVFIRERGDDAAEHDVIKRAHFY